MRSYEKSPSTLKQRLGYAGAVLIVIVLGISSRAFADRLPLFLSLHAGDALWGSMVYFGFRVLLTKRELYKSLIPALIFSYGIEFSQRYQADWINGIRATLPGGLILGQGFLWMDLLRYSVGIGLAYLLEAILASRLSRRCREK